METSVTLTLNRRAGDQWVELARAYLDALKDYPHLSDNDEWFRRQSEALISALSSVGLAKTAAAQIAQGCNDVFPEPMRKYLDVSPLETNLSPHILFALSFSSSIARKRHRRVENVTIIGHSGFPAGDPQEQEFLVFADDLFQIDIFAEDHALHFFARMLEMSSACFDQIPALLDE